MFRDDTIKAVTLVIGLWGGLFTLLNFVIAWWRDHRAYRLNALSALENWRQDVRGWAGVSIDLISTAIYCSWQSDREITALRTECVPKLSGQIELGRMYFPNIPVKGVGEDKLPAYRGYRHATLDPLIAVIRVLENPEFTGRYNSPRAALEAMRGHFVSQVQRALRPWDQNQSVANLIRMTSTKPDDETLGGLLPLEDNVPMGEAILHR